MKKLLILLSIFTLTLNAGDSRYNWANIGSFGLGEINNQLLIYCGDNVYFTSIPSFDTYWKWYFLWFGIIAWVLIFIRRKRKNR